MSAAKDVSNGAGAYALNALSTREREEFEAQLAESQDLRSEVTEMSDTAVLLGLAAEPVAPSAELKASIMAKIAVTPQLSRDIAPVAVIPQSTGASDAQVQPSPEASAVILPPSTKARMSWYSRSATALTAAAAAVAIIVGGVVVSNTLSNPVSPQAQAAQINEIYAASDQKRATSRVGDGVIATAVWSLSLGKSAVTVSGLDPLSSDKTYELWYVRSGKAVPAGLFDAKSNGSTSVMLSGAMASGDAIGVTIEPSGGSTTPTTEPVFMIKTA